MAKTGGGRGLRGGVGVGAGVNRNFNMGLGGAAAALSAWLMSQKENISNMDVPNIKFPSILSNPAQEKRPEILSTPLYRGTQLGILSTPAEAQEPLILTTPIEERFQQSGILSTPVTQKETGIVTASTEQVDNPRAKMRDNRTVAGVMADRSNQGTRRRAGEEFTSDMKLTEDEYTAMAETARKVLPSGERLNQTYVDRVKAAGRAPSREWETGHAAGEGFLGKPTSIISFDLNQLENKMMQSGNVPSSYEDVINWALNEANNPKTKGRIYKEIKGMGFDEAVSWLGAEHLIPAQSLRFVR